MKNTIAIAKREIQSFFVSPVAYFVITGFTLLSGWFFFKYLVQFRLIFEYYSQMPFRGQEIPLPNLNQHVVEIFYQTLILILVFVIPVLTMRLIAEERKSGTFELLATSPISVWSIVWGKFLGVAFILFVTTFLAFLFPLFLYFFAKPELAPILTGFLALFLCAVGFASVGMACSSLTENQVVGAITGTVALLLMYVMYTPAAGGETGWLEDVLKTASPLMQIEDLVRGVISLKSLIYFLSLILLGVCVSKTALDAQRWR